MYRVVGILLATLMAGCATMFGEQLHSKLLVKTTAKRAKIFYKLRQKNMGSTKQRYLGKKSAALDLKDIEIPSSLDGGKVVLGDLVQVDVYAKKKRCEVDAVTVAVRDNFMWCYVGNILPFLYIGLIVDLLKGQCKGFTKHTVIVNPICD